MRSISNGGVMTIVGAAILLLTATGNAQWQRMTTMAEIALVTAEVDNTGRICLVPIEADGVYLSEDGGATWSHDPEFSGVRIQSAHISGTDLYLLMNYELYRVPGSGQPAERIPSPRGERVDVFCVGAFGELYAAPYGNPATDSIYVSNDRGKSWQSIAEKISDSRSVTGLTADPYGGIWSHDPWHVYRLDIEQRSWTTYDGMGFRANYWPRIFPAADGDFFVNCDTMIVRYDASSGTASTIYKSTERLYGDLEFWREEDGTMLVAGRRIAERGFFARSVDDGAHWTMVDSTLPHQLIFLGEHDGWLYCHGGGQILRTRDSGDSFEDRTEGLSSFTPYHIEARGSRVHVMSRRYGLSGDGGETWFYPRSTGTGTNPHGLQVTSDGTAYEFRAGINISRDSMATWESAFGIVNTYALLARDDVVLVALGDSGIHRSTDQGRSWERVYQGTGSTSILVEHDGVLFGTVQDLLLLSSDRGATWMTKLLPEEAPAWDGALGVNDRVMLFPAAAGLWSSSDRGDTWTLLPTDSLSSSLEGFATNADGYFAAISYRLRGGREFAQDVLLSTDDGISWQMITDGLPETFTHPRTRWIPDLAFTASDRLLVNVWGRGIYAYRNFPTPVDRIPAAQGSAITLWPSVARDAVHVRCAEPRDTRLEIYDLSGAKRDEAVLAADAGVHTFNVQGLPAGTYFLHAGSGAKQSVTPFVVLR